MPGSAGGGRAALPERLSTAIANPDGWQQERNPVNDFYTLPVRPVRDDQGNDTIGEGAACRQARC